MKNILITGGLGFIGFNAVQLWKLIRPNYNYVIVDIETYAAKFMIEEKKRWLKSNDIPCLSSDICCEPCIEKIIEDYKIDTIVNFAAESHVDNSINDPDVFFRTNVNGVVNLLNLSRKHKIRFHQIGTDEVYGETTPNDWTGVYENCTEHPELKALKPSSPYSSSKASADMIAMSYFRTYGTKVTVSRCSNNFGRYQHTEKLIGTIVSKAIKNEKIPVYGNGSQKRHWIYVDEHNSAIMDILEKGKPGKIYNIAPPQANWITNMELIRFILRKLSKSDRLISSVKDRPGHDVSYFLYGTGFCQRNKLMNHDMENTIDWYRNIFNQ